MAEKLLQDSPLDSALCQSPVETVGGLDFNFDYLGFQFFVRTENEVGQSKIHIQSCLGCIPFSAESRKNRTGMLDTIKAARRGLRGQVHIEDGRWIVLSGDENFDKSLDAVTLLTGLSKFLILAKPYLDLLSEQVKRPGLSIRTVYK